MPLPVRRLCPWVLFLSAAAACAQTSAPKAPTDIAPGSITYEEIAYPYPVSFLPLTLYGQDVRMAYMDIPPSGAPNGRVVVLFHGMNFGGFYFGGPIDVLRKAGYRVVVPDQIGFGRSSKPIIPYNFNDMATNVTKLLATLNITRAAIVGHSMGGMLAARFAATHPDITERVVLYDPIGLTDVRYDQRWPSADDAYKATMSQTRDQLYQGFYASIRRYFPEGTWKPEYEKYARILYAPTLSADWPRLAMVRAIYRQITYLDPVVYDWAHIKAKALVIGGEKDGDNFPVLAKHIADLIPGAKLVIFPGVGHVPHIQVPELFNKELLAFLAN
ncbi:MAG TPA: alpha/beta hydrolase [Bryobacteraceae bacterium]|jgi:pimeloyl-ACP methyl ester carboxylesterase|nr:alpha/beta hydrolase [Bryobacteraceae bacterium]